MPPVRRTRFDPYRNFKFRVKWDGRYVAGVSRMGALRRTTEVIEHREGSGAGSPQKIPGRTTFDAITLERGVSHDADFERWANAVQHGAPGYRKDIRIELYNAAGRLVSAYDVHRCWVSEFQALPELEAS
jgi:phage tail-like protein